MLNNNFIKRWIIKVCRYVLRLQFLPIMSGPLKGWRWSTASSYDYILGNYEDPVVMKQFLSWLKPGSVYYDIGSNVGFHALVANQVINTGKIYAFEPMPGVREIFEKHISLNKKFINSNNITILPLALSDSKKQVQFSNDMYHREGNTYVTGSYVFKEAEEKIQVECQSIDGLIEEGYLKPDIIKIDVEGAEFDVLQGAKKTLEQYKPFILLATHDCHLPGVQQNCVQFLEALGYELTHTGDHHRYMEGLDNYIAIPKNNVQD